MRGPRRRQPQDAHLLMIPATTSRPCLADSESWAAACGSPSVAMFAGLGAVAESLAGMTFTLHS